MFNAYLYLTGLAALLVALGFFLRWALAVRSLRADAREEYHQRLADKPGTVSNIDEAGFVRLYVQSFQPRGALYTAAALVAAVGASPAAMLLVPAIYLALWEANGAPAWGGRTGYVFMFALFFGIVFIWAVIAGAVAQLHHRRTPEPWSHALARARGEPIPEESSWRRRPRWARQARPVSETDDPSNQE